jgi:hypothetical protein
LPDDSAGWPRVLRSYLFSASRFLPKIDPRKIW